MSPNASFIQFQYKDIEEFLTLKYICPENHYIFILFLYVQGFKVLT